MRTWADGNKKIGMLHSQYINCNVMNNHVEARLKNRILVGATANAPGAELADSSHPHECVMECKECMVSTCSQAVDRVSATQVRALADDEVELELNVIPKKTKQRKQTAAAACQVTASSGNVNDDSYSYKFLLDRLYQYHSEHFEVEKHHENDRSVMHANCAACAVCG